VRASAFIITCFTVPILLIYAAPALHAQAKPATMPASITALRQGDTGGMCFIAATVPASIMASRQDTSGNAWQEAPSNLSVIAGKSILIDCAQPVERVSVGLGDFAQATAITPSEIMLNGKTPGETSLIIWERGGIHRFFNVAIYPSQYVPNDQTEGIRRELVSQLPGQTVKVSSEGGTIFLSGTVKDLNSSQRAVQIASVSGKVINLLNVEVPPGEPQILLKVVFASIDRTLSKQLGMNVFSTGLGNTVGGVSTGQFSPPTVSATTPSAASLSEELNLFAFFPGLNLGATIQALQSKGLVQVLSEPNVLTENGKEGSFLAGGEFPFPVVQGGSTGAGPTITIQFKEFGVRLNFLPTITPRGTIHLQVAPEVSSLDFTNQVEVSGFQVPGIDVRKVKTEVELAEGQSFVIGGLLDNRETETFQKIPFLSQIPVLGKFFQSVSKNKTNTELIVIVTPKIVNPISVGTPLPELKYPEAFLPHDSSIPMNTPYAKPAGSAPASSPATMPVEKLVESMKPETPLTIEGGMGISGNTPK